AAFASVPVSSLMLHGLASEDETLPLAKANLRIAAVESALKAQKPGTGAPVHLPDIGSGRGNVDYRSSRPVEILTSGAASGVNNCDAGADIDCGPTPNPFEKALKIARDELLPRAISALSTPNAAPAKGALKVFGGVSQAANVRAGLERIKAHLPDVEP